MGSRFQPFVRHLPLKRCWHKLLTRDEFVSTQVRQLSSIPLSISPKPGKYKRFPSVIQPLRWSSSSPADDYFPCLTELPIIIWPNPFKNIKNWITSKFLIKRYFDLDFDLKEFSIASKKAVEVVSCALADGRFTDLEGLVTDDIIEEAKSNLRKFSLKHQQALYVKTDDILLCFPYEVGIIMEDHEPAPNEHMVRHVEITMCYHILHGLAEMKMENEGEQFNSLVSSLKNNTYVANYRFFRDFTKGKEPNWIINGLNYVKLKDLQ